MKNFTRLLTLLLLLVGTVAFAQPANDNCSSAVVVGALPWTSAAIDVTLATTTGDPAAPSCTGNIARSIWFEFTPSATGNHYISTCQSDAPGSTLPDIVLGIYTSTGGCAGPFTQVVCDDDACTTLTAQALISSAALTAGTTYYIVAWQYCLSGCTAPTVGAASIQLYIAPPPPAPGNDECAAATSLSVSSGTTCTTALTGQTTLGATQSQVSCSGTADDDVWYSFVASSTSHIVTLSNVAGSPTMVTQVFSGSCGTLTSVICGTTYATTATGLTSGQTYYVRVHTSASGSSTTFDICVTTPPPAPSNDNPCGAVTLTVGTNGNCSYVSSTTTAATSTSGPPAPGCANYFGGDVWFSVVVPASGKLVINSNTGVITDSGMALYSSSDNTCTGTFTLIECDDDDSPNGAMSFIARTGLTPGNTLFIRFWEYSNDNPGSFGICVTEPVANDECAGAVSLAVSPTLTCATALTAQSTVYATQSQVSCSGTADDDIWYSFVATSTGHIITLSNVTGSTTMITQVFSGTCGALTSLVCTSSGYVTNLSGLAIGTTYYLRVHSSGLSGTFGNTFDICVTTVVPPACTTNTAPSNGATGVALLPTLTWTAAAGATSYDIYFVGTLPASWVNPVNTASTSYTILVANTLASNTTYTWYITPRNSAGAATGCSSNTTTFTTLLAPTTFSGTGNWSDAARWSAGVPACGQDVTIAAAAVCAVDVAAVAGNVTIAATGRLNVSANSLTMGCTSGGGNRALSVSGTLNISGGTITVNGYAAINSGATFSQTGGDLVIDGNDGTAGGSVTSTNYLLSFANSGSLNTLSGGTITFVDPHFASQYSLYWNCTVAHTNASGSHTVIFGDGTSATAGGSSNGFFINPWVGSFAIAFNNLVINGPSASNRHFSSNWSFGILKDLTINSNADFRPGVVTYLAGNVTNNGTFTQTSTTYLGSFASRTIAPTANVQLFSGGGVWRNLTASPTANMANLTVNNTSGTPIVLPASMMTGTGTGSISSTLTLTAGRLDVSLGALTVGISTGTIGTITGGSATAYVIGELRKWRASGTGSQLFPVGNSGTYYPATVNFPTTGPSVGGTNNVQFISGDPGSAGLPAADPSGTNPNCFTACATGYWQIDAGNGLTGGTYSLDLTATSFPCITTLADARILKRPTAGGNWTFNGTHGTNTAGNVIKRTGLSGFSQFAISQGSSTPLPIELKSFTGKALKASNQLEWITSTEEGVKEHIIERSANGYNNWTLVGTTPSKGDARVDQSYSMEDKTPLIKSFYRLRTLDLDGREQFSNVISLTRQNNSFGVIAAYPNPAVEMINVQFNTLEEGNITARIVDMTGRLVLEQQMSALNGTNMFPVQLHGLSAGTYFITLSSDNEVAEPIRFVKQ